MGDRGRRPDAGRRARPTRSFSFSRTEADVFALLVGQAGPHHFSASSGDDRVQRSARRRSGWTYRRRVDVDVADRCRVEVRLSRADVPRSSDLLDARTGAIADGPGDRLGRGPARACASRRPARRRRARPRPAGGRLARPGRWPRLDPSTYTQRLLYRWRWTPDRRRAGPVRYSWSRRDPTVVRDPSAIADPTIASPDRRETADEHPAETATPQVFEAIRSEEHRQRDELELIASENYTSAAVMEAVGSVLTNKYAEGLPGKRYYGGCEFVDKVERLAIDRAKAALRRRARQRPAALGGLGQPGGLLRAPGDRRHRPGDGPGPGRPPDARDEAELLGPLVPDDRLRRRPQDRADRLRQARRARPRAQAEADPGRRQRLPADRSTSTGSPRSPARSARSSSSTWRTSPASSPPACTRAPSRWPTSSRRPRTRPCAARAGGSSLCKAGLGQEARLGRLPRPPGRPADARHRRQGGLLRRGAPARLQGLRRPGHRQRQDPGRGADPRRVPARSRAGPTTT